MSLNKANLIRYHLGSLALTFAVLSGCKYTDRVSVSSEGDEGDSESLNHSISADGRYVAFWSRASNLVEEDSNDAMDAFVRDTLTGTTIRVSKSSTGDEANSTSRKPSISADGRYVAFSSFASNLVNGDSNGDYDVFAHDTVAGTTELVSVNSAGDQQNGEALGASISGNGRYIAFYSNSTNLVIGDTNQTEDIFVRDTIAGTTTRVSLSSTGDEGNRISFAPAISHDGRYIAFWSRASNLVAGDTNAQDDIFLRDTMSGTTTRVSVDSSGGEGNNDSEYPSISANGRYVAFSSYASNLVTGDNNGVYDIFVRDTVAGTTTRVSVDSAGIEGNNTSQYPSISADGRYVAFESRASNLVPGDTNNRSDVFVRDTHLSTTRRVSVDALGSESDHNSGSPQLSADGRYVSFQSRASNLVAGDTNGQSDVVIRSLPEPTVASVIPDHLPIGATTSVVIKGTGFLPGTVVVAPNNYSNFTVVDENTINLDVTVPTTAQAGSSDLVISVLGTGPGALRGSTAICEMCVTFQ